MRSAEVTSNALGAGSLVPQPMKALLVDDRPLVRRGLRRMIELEWEGAEVREADSLADALRLFVQAPADLVVLDLAVPDAPGVEGLARLRRATGEVPILILSTQKDAGHTQRLLQMGAAGCVSKERAGEELIPAITTVMTKGRYVPPELADRLLTVQAGALKTALPHELLTPQEYRVMELIAAGHRLTHIATLMNLSIKTVGNYRMRILGKTGWHDNAELRKYCAEQGLVKPG